MKAVVIEKAGGPEVLQIKDIPRPSPKPGWVLIQVKAFGLNRSEMFTRQGHSPGVEFPRVLGIECVGIVEDGPGTAFRKGQKVGALMGGMGRKFDGGYAEYACAPESIVFPFDSDLDWATLGAMPEMFQTTWGSLHAALDIQPGQTLLIRGATSSIGMTATTLAKSHGLTVIGTTRNPDKIDALKESGVDHAIVDKGAIAHTIRERFPDGVDKVLELVGTVSLLDSLKCARRRGVVCMTGILGNEWVIKEFEPFEMIPPTIGFTVYAGEAEDLDLGELKKYAGRVMNGEIKVNIGRVFRMDEIVKAHQYMEENRAQGKLVVVLD
ncbi:MAG: zinc-binding alcohol dehydrogenase family protein [bacterium]